MKYKEFKESFFYKTAGLIDLYSEDGEEINDFPDDKLDEMEVVKFHRHGCVLYVTLK
jgi:hypothetical protein